MDNFRKPNYNGSCVGEVIGEDILESPHGSCCNSCTHLKWHTTVHGTKEVLLQHLDEDQSSQVDVSKLLAPNAALEKAEKKRKINKAYRDRCKKEKLQMAQGLVTLREENKHLKVENESLKKKNASMNPKLQSQTKELNKLKNLLDYSKFENKKQNTLVQILSDIVVNPVSCQENQKLKNENFQLREMVKLSAEQLEIVEENGKLHRENMLLKVQIDALCGKIVDENSKLWA